jgi:hypothetical protein
MSRKFSSLSEQFPISRKGGVHFFVKRGMGGVVTCTGCQAMFSGQIMLAAGLEVIQ